MNKGYRELTVDDEWRPGDQYRTSWSSHWSTLSNPGEGTTPLRVWLGRVDGRKARRPICTTDPADPHHFT